jgi:hypothetical protein
MSLGGHRRDRNLSFVLIKKGCASWSKFGMHGVTCEVLKLISR